MGGVKLAACCSLLIHFFLYEFFFGENYKV